MNKEIIIDKLKAGIIIPVIRVSRQKDAEKVAEIMIETGIKAVEITMSVKGAENVINSLRKKYYEKIVIGAGTVLSKEAAKLVIDSGAQFVVSPCFLEEVIDVCNKENIVVAPGTLTPTEIIKAKNYGADFIKIFPASSIGGPDFIKSIKAVYPDIDLMPTGGINAETAIDYLEAGATFLGVGSSIVNNKLINEKNFNEIKKRAEIIVNKVKGYNK